MKIHRSSALRVLGLAALLLGATTALWGCGALVRRAAQPVMDNLVLSTMKQDDLELVRLGTPGYLLMLDGLVEGNPDDAYTLLAAARLYSAYAGAFLDEEDGLRARKMTRRARDYAFRAMSLKNEAFARLHDQPFEAFQAVPASMGEGDEELLFIVVGTWAAYVEAHREDWDALADLPKIEALARRLLELDEAYYYGTPHLVLGALETLLPPSMGGKPEEAREHFEKAVEISRGRFLQAHVLYAERYARMVYDRPLHDRLLTHVLEAPADAVPELTLLNTVAKERARALLAGADAYF